MAKTSILNQVNGSSAEIMLYGIIGKWLDIDVDVLVPELEALKKSGVCNLTIYVNSDGGQVKQAQALWNYLNRSGFAVTWVIDGVAASIMAMLITNPKHTVIANKYSKLMYHRISGMVSGNSDEVRSYADMMDKFETDLIDMFATRTGLDKKKVQTTYFNNTDTWLNAQEALDLKLINEIRDGNPAVTPPVNLTTSHEVYDHFSTQLLNLSINNQTNIEMKKIALLLNLGENSTEDAIAAAVQTLINSNSKNAGDLTAKDKEIKGLNEQIAAHNQAKVKSLIDTAIGAKKFGEDMRETYTKMANDNYDMAEKVINNISGVTPVIGQLGNENVPEAEKNWKWDDYHKANKLENLLDTNRTRFEALYKEKFNKDYN